MVELLYNSISFSILDLPWTPSKWKVLNLNSLNSVVIHMLINVISGSWLWNRCNSYPNSINSLSNKYQHHWTCCSSNPWRIFWGKLSNTALGNAYNFLKLIYFQGNNIPCSPVLTVSMGSSLWKITYVINWLHWKLRRGVYISSSIRIPHSPIRLGECLLFLWSDWMHLAGDVDVYCQGWTRTGSLHFGTGKELHTTEYRGDCQWKRTYGYSMESIIHLICCLGNCCIE